MHLNIIPQIGQDATTLCLWFCNPPRPAIVLSLTQHPLLLYYPPRRNALLRYNGKWGSNNQAQHYVTVMLAYKTLKHVFGNLTRWCISRGISLR